MSEQVIIDGELSLDNDFDGLPTEQIIVNVTGAPKIIDKASGKIVSIVDGAEDEKLLSAIVNIEPVQSGSGDPSPTNIRPISGWTQVDVWVKPTYDTTLTPTATIPLGQTVYGGTLDVVRGKLVVDRVYANISQAYQVNWGKSSTYPGGFYLGVSTLASALGLPSLKNQTPFICSHAKTATTIAEYLPGTCYCDNSCNIRIMQASDTVNDWRAYLREQEQAGTPVQACFMLVTPQEYDVPPKIIKTLLGINNLWADAGSMEIEYVADTKLYIQRLTAPTEDDMIANENIASGKFFMVGNDLYLSTSAIVAGETIVPGTNCTKLSLAEALNNINA